MSHTYSNRDIGIMVEAYYDAMWERYCAESEEKMERDLQEQLYFLQFSGEELTEENPDEYLSW